MALFIKDKIFFNIKIIRVIRIVEVVDFKLFINIYLYL